jgi:hypothetical protein
MDPQQSMLNWQGGRQGNHTKAAFLITRQLVQKKSNVLTAFAKEFLLFFKQKIGEMSCAWFGKILHHKVLSITRDELLEVRCFLTLGKPCREATWRLKWAYIYK